MRLIDRITDALALVAGVILVATMVAIVYQTTARTLALPGSSHIFSATEFGMLYMTMLGSPWLVRLKGHVFIEILLNALPARLQRQFSRVVSLVCVIVCLIIVWYAGQATWRAWANNDVDMRSFEMPIWLLMGSIPLAFALMAIQFARFVIGPDVFHSGEIGRQ